MLRIPLIPIIRTPYCDYPYPVFQVFVPGRLELHWAAAAGSTRFMLVGTAGVWTAVGIGRPSGKMIGMRSRASICAQ